MTKKKYPAEFVKRVKAEYPNFTELHQALDRGADIAGRYLDDSSQGGVSAREVVKMIDSKQVKQLREKADGLVRRQKLYGEWAVLAQMMF